MSDLEILSPSTQVGGMKHVDMRKLPPAAQEERRRQAIGLRKSGVTYEAIAAQAGLMAELLVTLPTRPGRWP